MTARSGGHIARPRRTRLSDAQSLRAALPRILPGLGRPPVSASPAPAELRVGRGGGNVLVPWPGAGTRLVLVARVGNRGVRRPVRRFHARGLRVPHLPRRGERGRGGSRRHPPPPLRHVFVAAGSCGLHGEAGSRLSARTCARKLTVARGAPRGSCRRIPRPPDEMYAVDHWRYFQVTHGALPKRGGSGGPTTLTLPDRASSVQIEYD